MVNAESILNETADELITAFNKGLLLEWLQAEALEFNAEEKEILLAYGGYTLWVDLNKSMLCYHYGSDSDSLPISKELTRLLLQAIEEM